MAKNIKKKPLSHKEYNEVYASASPLIHLLLGTGVRIQEAKRIIDNYVGDKDYIDIKTKKSGNTKNRIFLSSKLRMMFDEGEFDKYIDKDIRSYTRWIAKESRQFNIDFTAHTFRTTFATRMIENGVDLVTLQNLMNHASVEMTAKYVQFDETRQRAAIESIDDLDTFEGFTLPEMAYKLTEARAKTIRLEEEIKRLKGEY